MVLIVLKGKLSKSGKAAAPHDRSYRLLPNFIVIAILISTWIEKSLFQFWP